MGVDVGLPEFVELTEDHAQQLERLCAGCADYYQEIIGLPPGPAEAQSLFLALPPGGAYDRKRLWGLFSAGVLIGVIDAYVDYPSAGHFWVGLLLLEPTFRRQGRGKAALSMIADHARAGGAHTLSLAVKRDHAAARSFWLAQGFRVVGERTLSMPGQGAVLFDLMDRAISLRPQVLEFLAHLAPP